MKIICIGRNYANHAKEMGSAIPTEPVFFMKPDTALLKEGDFYHPEFSEEVHHEIEVVVKISKVGKNIDEQFAHKYYNEISLGIDFTARDLQEKCKEKEGGEEKGEKKKHSNNKRNENKTTTIKTYTQVLEKNPVILIFGTEF
jgi:2-keto-4-pentenoate hydratase/2-oxohepta-3-ene-1,7-dioic acid hydratase in catechol pathway